MTHAALASQVETKHIGLRLHAPAPEVAGTARWLINGFPATIFVWTAEEWSCLDEQPVDAQPFPNGTWCALRID